ncbi:MAG: hypothetical protein U0575_04690 [Phycisphaerales bacterium]
MASWLGALLVIAVVALLVARGVMNPGGPSRTSRIAGAVDLAAPSAMRPGEQDSAGAGIDPESGVRLEAGAWVEVADPKTGRLAQRYSADRVDPLPERWVHMEQPRASFHFGRGEEGGPGGDDTRIVTLRGTEATAHVPRRALESGRIQGDVVVQLFRLADARGASTGGNGGAPPRIDPATDVPALEVHTQEAEFDGPLGRLRCDGDVDVSTPALRFKGRGLTMALDATGRTAERIVVETPVEPIRIDLVAAAAGQRGDAGTPRSGPTAAMAPATTPTAGAASTAATPVAAAIPTTAPTPTAFAPTSSAPTSAAGAASPAPRSIAATPARATAPPASTSAPATAPASSVSPAPTPDAGASVRFYRLTLHDNVHIERIHDGQHSTIEGDTLSIVFSMEGGGLRNTVASLFDARSETLLARGGADACSPVTCAGMAPSAHPDGEFGPLPLRVAALVLGSLSEGAGPTATNDELVITYTGRLVMTPTTEPGDILASRDDTRIEITGTPVAMNDPMKELEARCALVRYDSNGRRLELVGDGSHALEIDTPRAALRGERLWLVRASGVGRLEGAGSMRLDQRPTAAIDVDSAAVAIGGTADDEVVASIVASILAQSGKGSGDRARANGKAGDAARPELPLEITWQEGVDLAFDPSPDGGEGGSLREARFAGAVRVGGEDFAMRSDRLRVGFAVVDSGAAAGPAPASVPAAAPGTPGAGDPPAQGANEANATGHDAGAPAAKGGAARKEERAIREIEAEGAVHVERLGERGEMDASTMLLTMGRAEGKSVPEKLVANGAVAARDAARTIRSEALAVTFRPRSKPADPGAAPARSAPRGTVADKLGNVEIGTVVAERDVRVQLEDGARVYADRLDGDSLAGSLALAGQDIMIVRDAVVVDRLRDVRFDDATRTVHAPGPGRFRAFEKPVALPPLDQAARPSIPETAPLQATWTDALRYDDRANGGAGEIHLAGTVDVRSSPDAGEVDTLSSNELRLGLKSKEAAASRAADAARPAAPSASPAAPANVPAKAIATMTATGDAQLESKRWPEGLRDTLPEKLFRVRGESVRYDLATREASVDGAGQLLLHDVSPPKTAGESKTSFGSRGTSTFSWKGRMEMRRESDERYTIVLVDGVEIVYAGTRADDALTLTADRLEITLRRAPAPGGAAEGQRGGGFAGIDLGGGGEILRVRAVGRVFIRSPEQDVDTHEFDYNPSTGIAMLRGNTQRQVHVVVKGSPQPLRAESMRWDMREGRVLIERAGGTVGK